jgi:predicted nucleic acid-binding protein
LRLYLESNFLVELALEQEQSEACEILFAYAEQQRVELVMPAFAIMESLSAVNRRLGGFKELDESVNRALAQLERNASLATDAGSLRGLVLKARKTALDSFEKAKGRTLSVVRMLPLDLETLTRADTLRRDLGIELPDAVMLACVLFDLTSTPPSGGALFANRNTKDFDDPLVRESLRKLGCTLIFSFSDAAAKIGATRAP